MTAALLRRAGDRARSRARAVTGDRFDGMWLLRLAAPDVWVEPWAGVLDDVADVVDEARRIATSGIASIAPLSVRPYPCTDQRPETGSGELGRLRGRSRADSTTDTSDQEAA